MYMYMVTPTKIEQVNSHWSCDFYETCDMYLFLGSYTECVAFLRVIPAKVATIAANGDEQIGKMITEAFEKAGWMMKW